VARLRDKGPPHRGTFRFSEHRHRGSGHASVTVTRRPTGAPPGNRRADSPRRRTAPARMNASITSRSARSELDAGWPTCSGGGSGPESDFAIEDDPKGDRTNPRAGGSTKTRGRSRDQQHATSLAGGGLGCLHDVRVADVEDEPADQATTEPNLKGGIEGSSRGRSNRRGRQDVRVLGPNGAGSDHGADAIAHSPAERRGRASVGANDVVFGTPMVRRSIGVDSRRRAGDPVQTGREAARAQCGCTGFAARGARASRPSCASSRLTDAGRARTRHIPAG